MIFRTGSVLIVGKCNDMVNPVDELIKMFADAGATSITFHPEASEDPEKSLKLISDLGCSPGLVLNPDHRF